MDTSWLQPSSEAPRAADGRHISAHGQLIAKLKYGLVTTSDSIHILHGVGILLSWKTARDLHLLPRDYPTQISLVTSEAAVSPGDGLMVSQCAMGTVLY